MRNGLNLGCGLQPIYSTSDHNWINLDLAPLPQTWPDDQTYYQFDLETIATGAKLAFPDGHFDLVYASHTLEHVRGLLPLIQECHRLLQDGGHLLARVPYAGSIDAWEDPTHVRGFVPSTFLAFTQEYYHRADYGYRGDFDLIRCVALVPPEFRGAEPAELPQIVKHANNFATEIVCLLRAVKPPRKASGKPPPRPAEIAFADDRKVELEILKEIKGL